MGPFEQTIFKDKTFSSILEDIYDDTQLKKSQINTLIQELAPLVQNTGDAALIVPLIAKYLEMGIQNSDNLVKMAAIVQRTIGKTEDDSSGFLLSEKEKQQLLAEVNSLKPEKLETLKAPPLKLSNGE